MFIKKFLAVILTTTILFSTFTSTTSNIKTASAQPASWPNSWTLLDVDGGESGCPDHRDVNRTFYSIDSEYLYLRMEMVNAAGWNSTSPSGEARYKWWIDTVLGDAYIFGTSVADAEFLLILEDVTNGTNAQVRDLVGELTLLDDFNHSGFTSRWNNPPTFPYKYIDNDPGSSLWRRVHGTGTPGVGGIQYSNSSPDIGYNLTGNIIDMYISLSALGNPGELCLIYATDIHNNNIDQAPNCDSPAQTSCLGPVPVIGIDVEKNLTQPIGGIANITDIINFMINITNTGETNLTYIRVDDTFDPSKLQYINSTITPDDIHHHTPTLAHLHWNNLTQAPPYGIGNILMPEESLIINITFLALNDTYPNTTLNLVEIIDAEDEFSNHATDSDNASVTILQPPPDISVEKTRIIPLDGNTTIGEAVSFNITIINTGFSVLEKVNLTDTYNSTALNYTGAFPAPDSISSGSLFWSDLTENFTDISPGQGFTMIVNFTANATTNPDTHNNVTVIGVDTNGNSTRDSDQASVIIGELELEYPQVLINKTRITPIGTAEVGDQVIYQLNITNNGTQTLKTITVEDHFESNKLNYVSATPTPDHIHQHSPTDFHLKWDNLTGSPPNGVGSTLQPGSSILVNIFLLAVNSTLPEVTNNTVLVTDAEDVNNLHPLSLPSDIANVTINDPPPNILIEKELEDPEGGIAILGENVTFTIEITNTGGTTLTTVNLTDTYNSSILVFLTSNVPPQTILPGYLFWEDLTTIFGDLDPGEYLEVILTFNTSQATATGLGEPDTHDIVGTNATDQNREKVNDTDLASLIVAFPPFEPPPPPPPEPVGGEIIAINRNYLALFSILCLALTGIVLMYSREPLHKTFNRNIKT